MEKMTIPTMIAKNLASEGEAIKDYIPLLDAFEPGSDEYLQIAEIIADELAHSLTLTAMLNKLGLPVSEDAKGAVAYINKKI